MLTSYVAVFINVTDFNDNYPVFNSSSLVARVQENLNAGAFVARLQATDQDAQMNSLVSMVYHVLLYGMICNGMVRLIGYGMAWLYMWYGMIWYRMVCYG